MSFRVRAIENPSDAQLVQWATNNGLLARISPDLPPSQQTLFLLRGIYAASVSQWKRRGGRSVVRSFENITLRERVRKIFDDLGTTKRPISYRSGMR